MMNESKIKKMLEYPQGYSIDDWVMLASELKAEAHNNIVWIRIDEQRPPMGKIVLLWSKSIGPTIGARFGEISFEITTQRDHDGCNADVYDVTHWARIKNPN